MRVALVLLIACWCVEASSQDVWSWVNPLGQGDDLAAVEFVDESTAIAFRPTGCLEAPISATLPLVPLQ